MFIYLDMQKHPPEVFHKKGVLKNFAYFTGRNLCWSVFYILLKKVLLKISQNSQKNTCARGSFLIKLQASDSACNFIKNETLVQVFSCEFCESFKNTFFSECIRATASIYFILQCLNLN